MYDKDNVVKLPGSDRPEIDYTVGANGRIDPAQYDVAVGYLRRMNELCQGDDQKIVGLAKKESFAFADTLPKADKEDALATIIEESLTFSF